MKKLIGLGVIIAAYVAAAFYTGYLGEKNIRHQFALSQQQSEAQGVKLVLDRYERGIFFSQVDFTATYADMNLPFGAFTLSSQSRVQHGPLLFSGGFGVGLFASVSSVNFTTGLEEWNESIANLFGDSIGEIVTIGHFNNTYTSTWTVPEIDHQSENNSVKIAGITLRVEGNYTSMDMVGSFDIGAMDITSAEGVKITSTPITGKFDVENISEWVNITNMDMAMENMSFQSEAMAGASIAQLKIVQTQKLVNGKIDTFVSMTAASVKSPVEISSLYYNVTLNQLNPAAIQQWATVAKKMQADQTDPQQLFVAYEEDMTALMDAALQKGLHFKLGMGADFMGGKATLEWVADYQPLPDGKHVNDIVDPLEYLLLVNSDLMVRVSESIVSQTPLVMMVGQYMDTYITLDGDQYVMHATLKEGVLKVGNTELPKEILLAILPAGKTGESVQGVDQADDGAAIIDDAEIE